MAETTVINNITVVSIAVLVLQTPVLILFWWRRNQSPIKERMPVRALVALISISINYCATAYVVIRDDYNCYLMFVIQNYASSINSVAMLTRFLGYYLVYRLNRAKVLMTATGTQQLASLKTNMHTPTKFDRWILKHSWIVTWKLIGPVWAFNILVITIFNITSYPYLSDSDHCDPQRPELQGFLQFWSSLWVSVFVLIGFKLRRYVDGFHIQWELTTILKFALIIIVLWMIPPVNDYNQNQFPILNFLYFLLIEIEWFVTIILPIKWSYGEFSVQSSSTPVKIPLKRILERSDALDAFMQFLARDFCIESLYFLLAVRRLQEKPKKRTITLALSDTATTSFGEKSVTSYMSDSGLQASINEIYETFCKQNSPFMINISSSMLKTIETNLDGADIRIFDEAVHEIERLLEQNSLQRFLQSDLGQPLTTMAIC